MWTLHARLPPPPCNFTVTGRGMIIALSFCCRFLSYHCFLYPSTKWCNSQWPDPKMPSTYINLRYQFHTPHYSRSGIHIWDWCSWYSYHGCNVAPIQKNILLKNSGVTILECQNMITLLLYTSTSSTVHLHVPNEHNNIKLAVIITCTNIAEAVASLTVTACTKFLQTVSFILPSSQKLRSHGSYIQQPN